MAVAEKTAENKKNNVKTAGKPAASGKRKTGNKTAGKKTAAKKSTSRSGGNNAGKKRTPAAARNTARSVEDLNRYQDYQAFEFGITLFVLGIISILLYLSFFGLAGKAGIVISGLVFGVFGWAAWFLPAVCMIAFVFSAVNRGDRRVFRRITSFCGVVLTMLGLSDLLFGRQIITEYYTIIINFF